MNVFYDSEKFRNYGVKTFLYAKHITHCFLDLGIKIN